MCFSMIKFIETIAMYLSIDYNMSIIDAACSPYDRCSVILRLFLFYDCKSTKCVTIRRYQGAKVTAFMIV